MVDSIISLRVDKEILEKMRKYNEINWSAILRNCLIQKLQNMKETEKFDIEKAERANKIMREIRKLDKTKKGKTGVEIIREWREKRR